jgi:hypothetical protein
VYFLLLKKLHMCVGIIVGKHVKISVFQVQPSSMFNKMFPRSFLKFLRGT